MKKRTVLVFLQHYLPDFKSGGPVRSVSNIVSHLKDDFEFKIVCQNRGFLETSDYGSDLTGKWNRVEGADVFYAKRSWMRPWVIGRILSETGYDVIYLNSFLNVYFSFLPLLAIRFGFLKKVPVVLAPRGEFSLGAWKIRWFKKVVYFNAVRVLGCLVGVKWHASTEYEAEDIRRIVSPDEGHILVAPNLPEPVSFDDEFDYGKGVKKQQGSLRVVFLSRISPKKNLIDAIRFVNEMSSRVVFHIYGPVDDESYWVECLSEISLAKDNVDIKYCGSVAHDRVCDVIRGYDLFILPTYGENFGHVIFESLSVGVPVLLSDQTPWRGLDEKTAGYDIHLSNRGRFVEVLEKFSAMDESIILKWKVGARECARKWVCENDAVEANRNVFMGS